MRNEETYNKEIAAKNARIAELEANLKEAEKKIAALEERSLELSWKIDLLHNIHEESISERW